MRFRNGLRALVVVSLLVSLTISLTAYETESRSLVHGFSIQDNLGYAITGSRYDGDLGAHFSWIDDVNGDAIDDFIVSAPSFTYANDPGRVYLFHGKHDLLWNEMTLADAQASFIGEVDDDWFGRWTTGLGDIDGNGFSDFAISAIRNDEVALHSGKVYIYFGDSNVSWALDTPANKCNISITGEAAEDALGHGVYGVGDMNNDSFDDFIVSSFSNEGGTLAGQLYLFYGRSQSKWLSTYSAADANASWIGNPGDYVSLDAAGVGDINNDGFSDFAIGAWSNADSVSYRTVYLILGNDANNWSMDQPISLSNASFVGSNDTNLAGMPYFLDWISGAGDVNGDGFDDVLIGAHDEDKEGIDSGTTYLFFGRSTGKLKHNITFSEANASFVGEAANDWSGSSVGIVGDVNNDTFSDFVIGAPTEFDLVSANGRGSAYLFLGGPSGTWAMNTSVLLANYTFSAETVNDGFGFHVRGVGDVNNDSMDDFAIGAPYFDAGYRNVGKAYIILHYDQPSTWTVTTTTSTTSTTSSSTSTSTTTTTTTTSNPTETPPPFDMTTLLMIAVPVILVIIVGIVVLVKRR